MRARIFHNGLGVAFSLICLNVISLHFSISAFSNNFAHVPSKLLTLGRRHTVSPRLSMSTREESSKNKSYSSPPELYPISRRVLIEKAKEIDPALAKGERIGSYSANGWSNRLGTVLTPVSIPGVYTACRQFLWNNIDVGCRMTVIELPSTDANEKPDLFIHSPVFLDGPLKEALDKLGVVKHVVSPNYEHVKYAKMWGEAFPHANMWACPGMMERESDVRWTGELSYGCRPVDFVGAEANQSGPSDGMWDWDVIQPMHFDVEVNPFTGKAFFNEVVFFHAPSKTLLVTDTYWNYPGSDGITNSNYKDLEATEEDFGVWELAPKVDKIPLGSSLWKKGMDKLFRPFYMNLMVKSDRKDSFRNLVSHIVDSWDVETVIPAHGDTIRGKTFIRDVLRRHFNVA